MLPVTMWKVVLVDKIKLRFYFVFQLTKIDIFLLNPSQQASRRENNNILNIHSVSHHDQTGPTQPSPAQAGPAKMFPRLSEDICPDQYNWWLARYYPYLGASACVNISLVLSRDDKLYQILQPRPCYRPISQDTRLSLTWSSLLRC